MGKIKWTRLEAHSERSRWRGGSSPIRTDIRILQLASDWVRRIELPWTSVESVHSQGTKGFAATAPSHEGMASLSSFSAGSVDKKSDVVINGPTPCVIHIPFRIGTRVTLHVAKQLRDRIRLEGTTLITSVTHSQ